jgi:glycine/D-amino acid oxidase-like deaminating enzyme
MTAVVVLGGGIGGLAAAWRLASRAPHGAPLSKRRCNPASSRHLPPGQCM